MTRKVEIRVFEDRNVVVRAKNDVVVMDRRSWHRLFIRVQLRCGKGRVKHTGRLKTSAGEWYSRHVVCARAIIETGETTC